MPLAFLSIIYLLMYTFLNASSSTSGMFNKRQLFIYGAIAAAPL